MNKTVVIHQPDFIPYIGFFHRFLVADLYIALDHVQFVQGTSRSWTQRDKIKTHKGEHWLSISIKNASHGTPINAIELSTIDWRERNLRLIMENYRFAPYYTEIMPHIEKLYCLDVTRLVDFNIASIEMLNEMLDIHIPKILSSSLEPNGCNNTLLLDLLTKVGATHYLSGIGARNYLDESLFSTAGIPVIWQEFKHPVYPQQFGDFISDLSAIDLLFNCGVMNSRKILRGLQ